ncbi:hypothetical protein BC832DRAFT_544262 [Gaertneriomyces semiglobifer]|nr:hypothetical protein BC832DRAFT_544262 [Gaertneriomyces semiglobifer]
MIYYARCLVRRQVLLSSRTLTIGLRAAGTATKPCCHKETPNSDNGPLKVHPSALSRLFWSSRSVWQRASANTFRCLIGCSIGDFSMLFYLQAYQPHLPPSYTMAMSMAAGIATSVALETALLQIWESMTLSRAFKTAVGMSMISMLSMELVENVVDWHIMGGMVDLTNPTFWAALVVSMAAGYGAALPYNYWRLRKYGKACH